MIYVTFNREIHHEAMAIRKEKRLSPLEDKPLKKKEAEEKERNGDRVDKEESNEGGVDPQQDQVNDFPKDIEDDQNVEDEDKKG